MPDSPDFKPAMPTCATEPVLPRLYGAAVGSVSTDYYLTVFERFEPVGRWRASWNWAAATLTLNWLLFRQLWLAALAYAAALLVLPLLLLGLGRGLFALPLSIELGLWLGGALLSVVVPGLWGNALVHAQCQRRIERALADSATLAQALVNLRQHASARKHVIALVVMNALLASVALAAYVGWYAVPANKPEVAVRGPVLTASAASVAYAASGAALPAKPASTTGAASPAAPASPSLAASQAVAKVSQPESAKVYVNVGLFANANNALLAHGKLVSAGLPAVSEEVKSAKGQRTRVRAGPFASRTQAQAAAAQIKALQLEAVLAP